MHLQPQRLVAIAPPGTLGMLLEVVPETFGDAWAFDMTYQYVELRNTATLDNTASGSDIKGLALESSSSEIVFKHPRGCVGNSSTLLYMQPWTHLGYNEGSSLPAFSTYEHYSKRAPDILPQILTKLATMAEPFHSLTSLSYRSVFPITGNTDNLAAPIILQRSLTDIEIQLLPDDVDAVLHDPERMGRAAHSDLWLDARQSYMQLIFVMVCCNPTGRMVFTTRDKVVQEIPNFSKSFEGPVEDVEKGERSRYVRRRPEKGSGTLADEVHGPGTDATNATLAQFFL